MWLNDGIGAFTALPAVATSGGTIWHVAIANINANTAPDVILASDSVNLITLLNNGNGTLAASSGSEFLNAQQTVATGDLNGDGAVDVVVGGFGFNGVRYLRNLGDGTFATSVQITPRAARATAVADVDGDGKRDVLAVGSFAADSDLLVFRGDGAGGFAAPTALPGSSSARWAALGDLDGNTRADLVLSGNGTIEVMLDDGVGSFKGWPRYAAAGGAVPSIMAMALADLEPDGDHDIAMITSGGNSSGRVFLRGNPNGTFAPGGSGGASSASKLVSADLDGDGRTDFVSPEQIFLAPSYAPSPIASASSVAAGDLNNDNRVDLVFGTSQNVIVRMNTPTGFSPPVAYAATFADVRAIVDVDADGKRDLLVGRSTPELWRGKGDGTFEAALPAAGTLAADFDGDGTLDLVGDVSSVERRAVDMDRDGKLDIVELYPTAVRFRRGKGDGTFFPPTFYRTGGYVDDFVIGDFDHDGFPDVALNGPDGRVSVLLHSGCAL